MEAELTYSLVVNIGVGCYVLYHTMANTSRPTVTWQVRAGIPARTTPTSPKTWTLSTKHPCVLLLGRLQHQRCGCVGDSYNGSGREQKVRRLDCGSPHVGLS